jgi:hypothetical protein
MTALPELPPLTHEVYPETWIAARPAHQIFTAEHMRAYGRQCYAAGMELAAQIADGYAVDDWIGQDGALRCAAAIREATKG